MDLDAVDIVSRETVNMFPEYSEKDISISLMLFTNYIDKNTDDHKAMMLFVCMLRAAKEDKLNISDTSTVLNFIDGKNTEQIKSNEEIRILQKELWRIASLKTVRDYMKLFKKPQRTGCLILIFVGLLITSIIYLVN